MNQSINERKHRGRASGHGSRKYFLGNTTKAQEK
jgi:hypothetical protein